MLVILDTGPLGELVNPSIKGKIGEIKEWMKSHLSRGVRFSVPEIADFEVRRSLVLMTSKRIRKPSDGAKVEWAHECIENLNNLGATIGYIPLSTPIMLQACKLWATARRQGVPTAHDLELDCDVILAAQAITLSATATKERVIIATPNVGHLCRYNTKTVEAKDWRDIS